MSETEINFLIEIIKEDFKGQTHLIYGDWLEEKGDPLAVFMRKPEKVLENVEYLRWTWYDTPKTAVNTNKVPEYCIFADKRLKYNCFYFALDKGFYYYYFPADLSVYRWKIINTKSFWKEKDIKTAITRCLSNRERFLTSIAVQLNGYEKTRKHFCK